MKSLFCIAALVGILLASPTRANTERIVNAEPIPLETGCTLEKEVIDELVRSQRHYTVLEKEKINKFELQARNSPYSKVLPPMLGVDKIYIIDALLDKRNPPPFKIDHVFAIGNDDCIVFYFTFPDPILQKLMSTNPDWTSEPAYHIGFRTYRDKPTGQ